jgi:hypothetical protein
MFQISSWCVVIQRREDCNAGCNAGRGKGRLQLFDQLSESSDVIRPNCSILFEKIICLYAIRKKDVIASCEFFFSSLNLMKSSKILSRCLLFWNFKLLSFSKANIFVRTLLLLNQENSIMVHITLLV